MSSPSAIEEKISTYMSKKFLVDFGKKGVNSDTDLFAEGYIDSFGFIELVLFLEKEFGIKLNQNELMTSNINTLNQMVALIDQKLRSQAGQDH